MLDHLNSANAEAETQHKSLFSLCASRRVARRGVASAAADKDSPVVKTDKCPTTIRLSPLGRARVFFRRRRRSSANERHLVQRQDPPSVKPTPPDGNGAVI